MTHCFKQDFTILQTTCIKKEFFELKKHNLLVVKAILNYSKYLNSSKSAMNLNFNSRLTKKKIYFKKLKFISKKTF